MHYTSKWHLNEKWLRICYYYAMTKEGTPPPSPQPGGFLDESAEQRADREASLAKDNEEAAKFKQKKDAKMR